MFTNHVPFGAFRGFGAPQTQFATERHMDRIAQTLGLDPVEIRRINLIEEGPESFSPQGKGRGFCFGKVGGNAARNGISQEVSYVPIGGQVCVGV